MKATHYYKADGVRYGNVRVEFTVDVHMIAKEYWACVELNYINPNVVAKFSRGEMEKRIKERLRDYGLFAYEKKCFTELWDELSPLQKHQYYKQASFVFPDFFEGIKLTYLTGAEEL